MAGLDGHSLTFTLPEASLARELLRLVRSRLPPRPGELTQSEKSKLAGSRIQGPDMLRGSQYFLGPTFKDGTRGTSTKFPPTPRLEPHVFFPFPRFKVTVTSDRGSGATPALFHQNRRLSLSKTLEEQGVTSSTLQYVYVQVDVWWA